MSILKQIQEKIDDLNERLNKEFAPDEIVPEWGENDEISYPKLLAFIIKEKDNSYQEGLEDRAIFHEGIRQGQQMILDVIKKEIEGMKFNHKEGSCYNCNCHIYDKALDDLLALLDKK
jgi:hypothetical protein